MGIVFTLWHLPLALRGGGLSPWPLLGFLLVPLLGTLCVGVAIICYFLRWRRWGRRIANFGIVCWIFFLAGDAIMVVTTTMLIYAQRTQLLTIMGAIALVLLALRLRIVGRNRPLILTLAMWLVGVPALWLMVGFP